MIQELWINIRGSMTPEWIMIPGFLLRSYQEEYSWWITRILMSMGQPKILISSHLVHTDRHTNGHAVITQNFDIVPWWLSHARQNACIGMIQDSSRQMPLECDVNIAVNGFSGFATNPTRTEGSRLNRYQGNSFAFMSSREQIKHSLPTLSAEPLQAHSTLIFAFYYYNQTSLCYRYGAQPALRLERIGTASLTKRESWHRDRHSDK